MPQGQGPSACAHHLVGVARAPGQSRAKAPCAFRKLRPAPRKSLARLAGVDVVPRGENNRRPDLSTPGMTEFDSAYAWIQNFDDGNQNNNDKNNHLRVRAVRK